METHSSILARKILWIEDYGRLQSIRSQGIELDTLEAAELMYIYIINL